MLGDLKEELAALREGSGLEAAEPVRALFPPPPAPGPLKIVAKSREILRKIFTPV